jgi:hypothetical protein
VTDTGTGSVPIGRTDLFPPDELAGVTALCRDQWSTACGLRFVLPIEYPVGSYPERCARVDAFTFDGRHNRFWRRADLPTMDLFPHLAAFVNIDEFANSTATWWAADHDEMLWLTGSKARVQFELVLADDRRLGFGITGAQFVLFRLDLGFLVLDVRPTGDLVEDWFDLQHYFRFFARRGDHRGRRIALRHSKSRSAPPTSPLFTGVLQGGDARMVADGRAGGELDGRSLDCLLPLINLLLSTARLVDGEPERALDDRGRGVPGGGVREGFTPGEMLTYSALFLDGVAERFDARVLARCVNRFHCGQVVSPVDESGNGTQVWRYKERQVLFATIAGSGFLATGGLDGDEHFWKSVLPSHLRGIYFVLFLLVAYQRLALIRLSEEVAERSLERHDLGRFTQIHERVLEFTARGLFTQVARHPHHHQFYKALQQASAVAELQQEVRDEVAALKEYAGSVHQKAEEERGEHIAARSRRLQYLLGVLSVLAAINLWASKWPRFGSLSRGLSLLVTLAALAVAGVVVGLIARARSTRSAQAARAAESGGGSPP